jgi:hypothetical protein
MKEILCKGKKMPIEAIVNAHEQQGEEESTWVPEDEHG